MTICFVHQIFIMSGALTQPNKCLFMSVIKMHIAPCSTENSQLGSNKITGYKRKSQWTTLASQEWHITRENSTKGRTFLSKICEINQNISIISLKPKLCLCTIQKEMFFWEIILIESTCKAFKLEFLVFKIRSWKKCILNPFSLRKRL